MLFVLTVTITLNSFGQIYEDDGNRSFQMNVTRAGDDSSQIMTVIYKDGPLYIVILRDGKVQSLCVDGRPVSGDSLARYQKVIEQIKVRVKEAEVQMIRDRAQAERDREQAGRDREQAGRDRELSEKDRVQADRDRMQAERNREQDMKNREQNDLMREQAERDRAQADLNRDEANRDKDQAGKDRMQAEKDRMQADQDRQQAERDREQAGRDREQAVRDREQAERDRKQAEEDRRMMEALRKDLVQDGVVKDKDDIYDIKIDEDEVMVNGKRLPEALEKKYIAKYATRGNRMQFHTSHKGGMNLSIEHDN
jgi:hypothetical protein